MNVTSTGNSTFGYTFQVAVMAILAIGLLAFGECYGQSPEQKKELAKADADEQKLIQLYKDGDYAAAAKIGERIKQIRQRILGNEHPDHATSLNNLALLYNRMGSYERAEPLYLETIKIKEKVLGKEHPCLLYTSPSPRD